MKDSPRQWLSSIISRYPGGRIMDRLALIVVGLFMAATGWVFFNYFWEYAKFIFVTITMVTLLVDNRRLRRELKAQQNRKIAPNA